MKVKQAITFLFCNLLLATNSDVVVVNNNQGAFLPLPFYILSFKRFNFSFLLWSLQLVICIFLILAPIPKLYIMQVLVAIALGALLTTNHLLGFLMFPEQLIWWLSYGAAIVAGILTFMPIAANIVTSIAASYILVYLAQVYHSTFHILQFVPYMIICCLVCLVFCTCFPFVAIPVYKALVCTLAVCIILNLCTFINIIESLHASNLNIVAGMQIRFGRLIVIITFFAFLVLIFLSNMYRSNIERMFGAVFGRFKKK